MCIRFTTTHSVEWYFVHSMWYIPLHPTSDFGKAYLHFLVFNEIYKNAAGMLS